MKLEMKEQVVLDAFFNFFQKKNDKKIFHKKILK